MKERLCVWPMKALAAFCLLTGMLPASVLLGKISAPEEPLLWWLPPVAAFLWGIAGYLLPKKGKVPFTAAGCLLFAAWGVFLQMPLEWTRIFMVLPCVALLLALPPAWGRPAWDEWPAGAWFGGVVVHLLSQSLSYSPLFTGILPYLRVAFGTFVFLFLLSLNRHSITDGMHGAQKAPAALRRRNAVLVTGMFILAVAAACWSALACWLDVVWRYIKLGIGYVIAFLMQLLPAQEQGAGGGGGGADMLGGMEEAGEPSLFAIIMEKVFMVLAALAFAVLLVLAARAAYKGLKKLWKRILDFLRRYAAEAGEDYIDETETTLNWDERAQSIRDQVVRALKRPEKPPRWEDMNGRQRVRFLYRQFLRRRPEAKAKTAREALTEDKALSRNQSLAFAQMYEQARYSEEEISAQEADGLRKSIKM